MAYERINWQNEPSEATALNDVNLNKMDSAIYDHDQRLDTAESELDDKVDKVTGKALSQVDDISVISNTSAGTKIGEINVNKVGGSSVGTYLYNGVVVDSALSSSSENPVQNKVINTALANKVDKEAGKGLSSNDYTTAEKNKLAGIETGANKTIVDSSLSGSSTNPVQNKVVKSALDGKVDKVTNYGLSLYKDIGYYQTAEGQTGTYIGYVGGKKQNGQLQALGDIYNGVVVDSALSSSSTNPVENKAIYDALNNLLPSKTVSGNPISISDASGFDAKELTVSMNPIQDLHGYSNPWVGGAGKNMIDLNINTSVNSGSIVFDTPITETVTISAKKNDVVISEAVWIIDILMSDNTHVYIGDTGYIAPFPQTIIATPSKSIVKLTYRNYGITSGSYDIQMEKGSTATTFVPYSNICPISGRTEASVKRTGSNVWGGEALADDIVSKVPNATKDTTEKVVAYTASNISSITNLFTKFKPNTRYTAIIRMKGGVPNMRFEYTDGTSTGISVGVTVSTEGKTVKCISGQWQTGSSSMYYDQSGIFEGVKTADDFEPYTAETHTHQYPQEILGGVDDFVNGGATSTMGMVDLGDLTWTYYTAGDNPIFYASISDTKIYERYESIESVKCSNYKNSGTANQRTALTSLLANGDFSFINGTANVVIRDDNYTSATDFKTAMDGVQLCYELATPATISTSAEEIELLKGQNVLSTDADDIELKYSVSLDSLLPTTTRTLAKSPIVEEPKVETDETEEQR